MNVTPVRCNLESIWLTRMPIPPSVNASLIPRPVRKLSQKNGKAYWGAGQRLSPQSIEFKKAVSAYGKVNRFALDRIASNLKKLVEQGWVLRVDVFIAFEESRVFSSPNRKILQLDGNNRIKPLLDGVASLLGIDDSVFFRGDCEKVTTASKESECTLVRIQPVRPRTLQQIQQLMLDDVKSRGQRS